MLAEAGEIAGPGGARVDGRGHGTGAGEFLGIDAERGAAPIDVGVHVDEAGRDKKAAHILHHRGGPARNGLADCGNLAAGEADLGHGIERLGGIDHAAARENEIHRHFA